MTKNTLSFFTGVLLTCILFSSHNFFVKNSQQDYLSKDFTKVVSEIHSLVQKYKDPADVSQTQEALLRTLVNSYEDPYTSYISKEESVMFDTMIGGDFEGIGAYIEDSPNGVFIQGTLPNSPAQIA